MADFSGRIPEQPKETKVDDNIVSKLAQESLKPGEQAPRSDNKIAAGSDSSVSLPKMAIDSTPKGVDSQIAETAKQFMPDLRDGAAVTSSQRALGEMVNKAVAQAQKGDTKPAENLSTAITIAADSTRAHIGDLNRRVEAVTTAMTKST